MLANVAGESASREWGRAFVEKGRSRGEKNKRERKIVSRRHALEDAITPSPP